MWHSRFTTSLLATFLLCGFTACQAQTKAPAAPSSATAANDGHTWHLKREEKSMSMTDWQTNQQRSVKLMNMLLPVGWQLQAGPGGNSSTLDCADTSGGLLILANNPENTLGVVIVPTFTNMSTDSQAVIQQERQLMQNFKAVKCTIEEEKGLAASLREGISKLVPGAQLVGQMEPIPGLSEQLPGIVAAANRNGVRITAEAGRQRFTGTFHGKPSECWLVSLGTNRTEQVPGGMVTYHNLPLAAILFAPPGQLDRNDKLLMTLLSSVQVDPDWSRNQQAYAAALMQKINGAYAQVNRIHQQMQEDNARAAAQQQAIRNNTANYRSQVMSSVASNRSAALDHSSQQFALYMGDQAIYKDPTTGQHVQMSSGYDHVWASTTGNTNDYILTDSPSFNPNGQVGSSGWTQMEMVH
jgi:hypothetical protein